MDTVTCTNPDCTENGVPKDLPPGLPTDIPTFCGTCGTQLLGPVDEPVP
jgi:hypothetical protein